MNKNRIRNRIIQTWRRIPFNQRWRFEKITSRFDLVLNFEDCRDSLKILEDIFTGMEYGVGFPFKKNAIVVDLGGHYGFFALWANKNLGSNGMIYTVEPNENNFTRLRQNISNNNLERIDLWKGAISSRNGKTTLYDTKNSFNSNIVREGKELGRDVASRTLDTFFNKKNIEYVDFLKMDVEGAEFEILLNAKPEALKKIHIINMEFHDLRNQNVCFEEIESHLFEHNFVQILKEFRVSMSNKEKVFGQAVFKRNAT